jgi:hypothetical protein
MALISAYSSSIEPAAFCNTPIRNSFLVFSERIFIEFIFEVTSYSKDMIFNNFGSFYSE